MGTGSCQLGIWDAKVWSWTAGSLSAGAELTERQQDAQPLSHKGEADRPLGLMSGCDGLDYQYANIISLCGKYSLVKSTAVVNHFPANTEMFNDHYLVVSNWEGS